VDQREPEKLTEGWMKALLEKVVLDRRMNIPGKDERYELMIMVSGMRFAVSSVNRDDRVSSDRNRRLLAALKAIAEEAPATIAWEQFVIGAFPQVARTVDRLSDLTGLHTHAARILSAPERAGIRVIASPSPIGWHDYCFRLAEEFRKAMASTNPGLTLKVSNNGAIAKFIAAVAPVISNEHPKTVAVARFMARNPDRGNIFGA
jgi:hypothetical protein